MLDEILHVQVLLQEIRRGGEVLESGPYAEREDETTTLDKLDVVLASTDTRPYHHTFQLLNKNAGDDAYVVIVRYSAGDTFGRSYGEIAVLDVFAHLDDAEGLVKAINDNLSVEDWKFEYLHREYYAAAWKGYFERFEHAEIHKKTILRDTDDPDTYRHTGYLYFE